MCYFSSVVAKIMKLNNLAAKRFNLDTSFKTTGIYSDGVLDNVPELKKKGYSMKL